MAVHGRALQWGRGGDVLLEGGEMCCHIRNFREAGGGEAGKGSGLHSAMV